MSEYDTWSDVALAHKVRSVPAFLILADGGAVIRRLSISDVRRLVGSAQWVSGRLASDMQRLKDLINQAVIERAPSTLP